MKASAVITGYNDLHNLKSVMKEVLKCEFDEIILAIGGLDGTKEYAQSVKDRRVQVIFEDNRIGKMAAIKRALEFTHSDIIYFICSDVRFAASELWRLSEFMDQETGAVVPRVVPSNTDSVIKRVAALIWSVRNHHLAELDKRKLPLHGGEVLVIRKSITTELNDVVNDDAFMCMRAIETGYRVRFAESVLVYNVVPGNFRSILKQRERINYGHAELSLMRMRPSVMSRNFLRDPELFFSVMLNVIRKERKILRYLPLAIIVEFLSIILSKRDRIRKRNLMIWPIVTNN